MHTWDPNHRPRGPRPIEGENGNWKCTVCSTINFASRTECHTCRRPGLGQFHGHTQFQGDRGGFQEMRGFQNTVEGTGPRLGGAPVEGIGGNWRCPTCANVNFAKRENCNRCQTDRPPLELILAREQELEQERALAAASGATIPNIHAASARKFAPPVAGVDGNWECLTCSTVNFASRESCHRCTAGRPPQEHIKARAEQIKTERAVAIASGGAVAPPPVPMPLQQPAEYPPYYPYAQQAPAPPSAYPPAQPAAMGSDPVGTQYPYDTTTAEGHSKRQRVDDAGHAHGTIQRGPLLRGGECATWVSACGLLYLSSLTGMPMERITQGCDLPSTSAQGQTVAMLANLEAVLTAAGSSRRHLVDVQIHVMEQDDVEAVNAGWLTCAWHACTRRRAARGAHPMHQPFAPRRSALPPTRCKLTRASAPSMTCVRPQMGAQPRGTAAN
jgi:enamine deaminase RidA (YjgF/YER057c/UK114 family)